MPGFKDVVEKSWGQGILHREPCQVLFHKLARMAKCLRAWSASFSSNAKLHLHMALEIILRLDESQDFLTLSPEECEIRKILKRQVKGLAVMERARKKQSARMVNLKKGDANTKYFHMKINARRRKNFILHLKKGPGWVTKHEDIEQAIHTHFAETMKKGTPRSRDFNWDNIPNPEFDLTSLADGFTKVEVHEAIKSIPPDKAPWPDGFTSLFFKACWNNIKEDLMKVIKLFSNLHSENFHWLNTANIVLLPKKDGVESVNDFRPISLIHAVAKIISKMLATHLTPYMTSLVSRAQSAFIKSRSIHDNYTSRHLLIASIIIAGA
jgi:hypothetical protein